jgi:hypothetical protein
VHDLNGSASYFLRNAMLAPLIGNVTHQKQYKKAEAVRCFAMKKPTGQGWVTWSGFGMDH